MAHLDESSEAAVEPVTDVDSAAAAIAQTLGDEEEFADEETTTEGEEEGEEADLDLEDEEEDDGEGEPETAIDAPASFNAEEKALFASMTPEQRTGVAAIEARRNADVQSATTKASEAQRNAEARAAAADAEAQRIFAAQLDQFVGAYAPQAPDPQLAYDNPQAYVAQKAQYDAQKAQHDELVQQVKAVGTEANEQETKAFLEQRDRELMQIPEVANEETRGAYLDRAFKLAADLGYDQSELAQTVSAAEVKHLTQIAEWRDKAGKYEKAMERQMTRVRAGKQRTMKPGAAQPSKGSGDSKAYAQAKSRLKQTGSVDDAAAIFEQQFAKR